MEPEFKVNRHYANYGDDEGRRNGDGDSPRPGYNNNQNYHYQPNAGPQFFAGNNSNYYPQYQQQPPPMYGYNQGAQH